jgi:hypothetical protein
VAHLKNGQIIYQSLPLDSLKPYLKQACRRCPISRSRFPDFFFPVFPILGKKHREKIGKNFMILKKCITKNIEFYDGNVPKFQIFPPVGVFFRMKTPF